MRYPRLYIETNHGFLLLADATIEDGQATGIHCNLIAALIVL